MRIEVNDVSAFYEGGYCEVWSARWPRRRWQRRRPKTLLKVLEIGPGWLECEVIPRAPWWRRLRRRLWRG